MEPLLATVSFQDHRNRGSVVVVIVVVIVVIDDDDDDDSVHIIVDERESAFFFLFSLFFFLFSLFKRVIKRTVRIRFCMRCRFIVCKIRSLPIVLYSTVLCIHSTIHTIQSVLLYVSMY